MLVHDLEATTPRELLSRLSEGREITDALFATVHPEALYARPIAERHRIIFYIGHVEAFDWNLLNRRMFTADSFSPDLDRLFAFGIDPVDGGLPADQPADWPQLEAVQSYVKRVRSEIDDRLANVLSSAEPAETANILLNVAIEHRLMHAETLAYMLHRLPYNQKFAQTATPQSKLPTIQPSLIEIPAGSATLGLSRSDPAFGWDNEYERQTVDVPAFAIDRHKVTNREFLQFMEDGGYERRELWRDADWEWKETSGISHPAFWRQEGREWAWKGMFQEFSLPADWPVFASQAEASAYARWTGKVLPTEEQWQRAAYGSEDADSRDYPWGPAPPDSSRGNFDFQRWDPAPVGSHPSGTSAFGVEGMLGNGWEWTSTLFHPFSGFKPFPFYLGYSADFFDGKHYVMRGASPRTAACMLRPSFRNWFQPHYQYVYAGFRCVSERIG